MFIRNPIRLKKAQKIALFGVISLWAFLMAARSAQASSYLAQKGSYETDAYILSVSWGDIYNVRPKPVHYRETVVSLRPKSGWVIYPSSCTAEVAGAVKKLGSTADLDKVHSKEVRIRCTLKSTENKSITQVDTAFVISSSGGDIGKRTLKIAPKG